ncbi:MAG TPA: TIGR04282 family arsenosugar biosynthesis glycosyltransferase, partial [Geobacteraceae bacterium]|nr:TIGR04282 family arsenosugar biosynthesis glycosyltransferase [Geobacteraceae bacterium]
AFFAGIAPWMACTPQRGADLGERMASAFAELFAMGYGRVAIIGTDLPDLPLEYVEEAFRRLANRKVDAVFGPAEDGGYYLIAMRKLHGGLFRDIPWSSGTVLARSLERAEEDGIRTALLPPWHDVDTAGDLYRPELMDEKNGAPLTRAFIGDWLKGSRHPAPAREGL